MRFAIVTYAVSTALFLLPGTPGMNLFARDISGTVSRVSIENNGGVPESRIRVFTDIDLQKDYDPGSIRQHIARLMKSGLLYDVVVTARSDGTSVQLSYSCIPLPVLRSITAEAGVSNKMKRLPPKLVNTLFSVIPNDRYDQAQIINDLRAIEDMYHTEHFHDTRVYATGIYEQAANAVNLSVSIDRGTKTFAYDIIIQGNFSIDTDIIAPLLHSRKHSRLLFEPGYYDPRQFNADAAAIKEYYLEEGFLDAAVTVERAPGARPERVYIIVRIIEGPRYTLGAVNWKQRVFSTNQFEQLAAKLDFEEGEVYYSSLPDDVRDIVSTFCVEELDEEPDITIAAYMNEESDPMNPVVDIAITIRGARNGKTDPYRIPPDYYQSFSLKPVKK
jgi:outer membrane protein assembly factor BamA